MCRSPEAKALGRRLRRLRFGQRLRQRAPFPKRRHRRIASRIVWSAQGAPPRRFVATPRSERKGSLAQVPSKSARHHRRERHVLHGPVLRQRLLHPRIPRRPRRLQPRRGKIACTSLVCRYRAVEKSESACSSSAAEACALPRPDCRRFTGLKTEKELARPKGFEPLTPRFVVWVPEYFLLP